MVTSDSLKLEIKRWEHRFQEQNGKPPSKLDIKQNASIAAMYKRYKELKQGVRPALNTPSKNKDAHHLQLQTPQKTSPAHSEQTIEESPLHTDELGPTPQLDGRVLGLFEVITSPHDTPSKKKESPSVIVLQTPTKKRSLTVSSGGELQPSEFKTPMANRLLNIQETPAYLKNSTRQETSAISPSPLASQRMKKGLSTIMNEFRNIQEEMKTLEYKDPDIKQLTFIEETEEDKKLRKEDADEDDHPDKALPIWKKKPPKRTTRRYKVRARPNMEFDEMADKDIKEEISKLRKAQSSGFEASSDEEWSDEEDEYIPRDLSKAINSGKSVERKNFKRLKLRTDKKKGRFSKRYR